MFEAAEAPEDLFPLQGELSGTGTLLMEPGGSASLGFPFSAPVSMSEPALSPEELCTTGKGGFEAIHPRAGVGLGCCAQEIQSLSLQEGLPQSWPRVGEKESKNFTGEKRNPRISSLMHFLKGGVCPREHMSWIILWECGISFIFLFQLLNKKNHFILLFTSSLEHGHIYLAFNHLC